MKIYVLFHDCKWKITSDSMERFRHYDYYIPGNDRINGISMGDKETVFGRHVYIAGKTWLSREDVYALNSAIIYQTHKHVLRTYIRR